MGSWDPEMKCKTHRENAPLELGEELQSDRDMVTKTREEQRSSRDTKLECKIQRSEGNLSNKHATERNWAGQCTEPDDTDNTADRRMRLLDEAGVTRHTCSPGDNRKTARGMQRKPRISMCHQEWGQIR